MLRAVSEAESAPDYPAELYAALHRGNPGDVEFYARVCKGAQRILELGCGDGRVLLELAAADRTLAGLDVHPGLLRLARARGVEVEWFEGDMCDPPSTLPSASFDRVIVPFGGMYCPLTPAGLDDALRHAYDRLTPGGRFAFDVWAADDFHADHDPAEQDPSWQDHLGRFDIAGKAWEIIERSEWRPEQQRIDVVYTHVPVGEYEAVEGRLPQRYFLHDEITKRLRATGFDEIRICGGFGDEPYGPDAELMVVQARKPG